MSRAPASGKETTRIALLEAGARIMLAKGYTNTGLQEVLDSVGVPKGSFYYYFDSKEDFALQIIDYFDCNYYQNLCALLEDSSVSPLTRLKQFCLNSMDAFEENNCRQGCLIGNLSQEMADQSEALRAKLEESLTRWRNRFAACIKEGQDKGEIDNSMDHVQMAEFFLNAWHGAFLRAKTTKTVAPQKAFMRVIFDRLLQPR